MSARTPSTDRKVGAYVRAVDAAMFQTISQNIGSKSISKVGAYVYTADADTYDRALEDQ
jgi:hypothetical protein